MVGMFGIEQLGSERERETVMDAVAELKELIRGAIRDHAAYALDDDEENDLVDMIADAIVSAGWPRKDVD